MSYEEKAKELNEKTDGMVKLALGLHRLCFDADKEITELKDQLANSISKERVEALCDQINSSNSINITRFSVIQSLKKMLSNQPVNHEGG